MASVQIPFSLEQEFRYRNIILSTFGETEHKEFRKNAGVLVNMAIHQVALYLLCVNESNSNSADTKDEYYEAFQENYRKEHGKEYDFYEYFDEHFEERASEFADFYFLDCYILDWLYDREIRPWRIEIEKREFSITGKISKYISENHEVASNSQGIFSFRQMIVNADNRGHRKNKNGFGKQRYFQ